MLLASITYNWSKNSSTHNTNHLLDFHIAPVAEMTMIHFLQYKNHFYNNSLFTGIIYFLDVSLDAEILMVKRHFLFFLKKQ